MASSKPTLFFGTNNPHKLREIYEIVGDLYEIISFKDLERSIEVEETEPTLEGNAELKARAFYKHTGIPCFADDTGLEVSALGGRPGVKSARYAHEHATFEENVDKLLAEMQGKEDRKAQFRTVIAYFDGEEIQYFEGEVRGDIGQARQGEGGFGYDPVFFPEGKHTSFAEMSPKEKNDISHRGRAVRKFAAFLRGLIS